MDTFVETRIARGTPAFRRLNLGLFAAGWSTFGLIYCCQPLMPELASTFHVSPAASSLTVSATTGMLAFMLLVMGSLSESFGRKGIMSLSLLSSALLTLAGAFAPNFDTLVILRGFTGIAIAGIPSIAMAYLGEELEPRSLGYGMGLFIGGSACGGMSGRFISAMIADVSNWRYGVAAIGLLGLGSAWLFWRSLPPSRHFAARPLRFKGLISTFAGHLGDQGLPWLFALSFLLMGSFTTMYNYIGFRLTQPPYSYSQSVLGVLFCVYIVGMISSTIAGRMADRYGRRRVLWMGVALFLLGIAISCGDGVLPIVLGIAIVTFGFFAAHSIASSWVGRRATVAKAQAASLYLFSYYIGSSVVGTLSGYVWAAFGWWGVASLLTSMQLVALGITLRMAFLAPLPSNAAKP